MFLQALCQQFQGVMILHNLPGVLVSLAEGDPDVVVLDHRDPDPGHHDDHIGAGDAATEVSEDSAGNQGHPVLFTLGGAHVDKFECL